MTAKAKNIIDRDIEIMKVTIHRKGREAKTALYTINGKVTLAVQLGYMALDDLEEYALKMFAWYESLEP